MARNSLLVLGRAKITSQQRQQSQRSSYAVSSYVAVNKCKSPLLQLPLQLQSQQR